MPLSENGGTGSGGWNTSGSTQNNSPRGLGGKRGKGGASNRSSLDQLLNEQGLGPGSNQNKQDGLEETTGDSGSETSSSKGGKGARLSFMVLSTLRKKLTSQAVKLKELHEDELKEAEAQAQVNHLLETLPPSPTLPSLPHSFLSSSLPSFLPHSPSSLSFLVLHSDSLGYNEML